MEKDKKSVELTMFTRAIHKNSELGNKILSIIFTFGREVSPEKVEIGGRWNLINQENYSNVTENWGQNIGILMHRENRFESEIALLLGNQTSSPNILSFWVENLYFENINNLNNFLDLSKKLYYLLDPQFGFIHSTEDKMRMNTVQDARFGKTIIPVNLSKGLPGVYWANFYSKEYVKKIGKGIITSAPWFKVEELEDNGIFTLSGSTPLINPNLEYTDRIKKLREYLGTKYFYP